MFLIVLRGVLEHWDTSYIKDELIKQGFKPTNVIRWYRPDGQPSSLVLILLPKEDRGRVFNELTEINGVKIRVETQQSRFRTTQCPSSSATLRPNAQRSRDVSSALETTWQPPAPSQRIQQLHVPTAKEATLLPTKGVPSTLNTQQEENSSQRPQEHSNGARKTTPDCQHHNPLSKGHKCHKHRTSWP